MRAATSDPRPALSKRLSRRFFAEDVILCDSGTHALEMALRAVGGSDSAPVLVPAYSCYDVATAVFGAGREAILYDIEPETLSPDMDSVRKGLAREPAALVVGPLYGMAFSMDDLRYAARAAGAVLIEDAAQGHGAAIGDHPSGSLGDLSVLSFGRGKGWTGGGGGALLFRNSLPGSNELLQARVPPREAPPAGLVVGSKTVAQWILARPSLYRIPASLPWLGLGETHFKPPSSISHMAPWSAALVLEGEHTADAEAEDRRDRGGAMVRALQDRPVPGVTAVTPDPGCTPGYLRVPLLREGGMAGMPRGIRRRGIAPGYPRSLVDLPPFQPRIVNAGDDFPGARRLGRELVTLPSHGAIRASEVPAFLHSLASRNQL